MKLLVEIELGNDAMQCRDDVRAAIDYALTRKGDYATMHAPLTPGETTVIYDGNGNSVGAWTVTT